MTPEPATYPAYRFPAEVICHAVWLYHVFSLSLRDVELILAERGIVVTHESIRQWCRTFGTDITRRLRKRRPRPGDTWHMDEVFIRIRGELLYLGAPWTRMALCSTSWSKGGGTRPRPSASAGAPSAKLTMPADVAALGRSPRDLVDLLGDRLPKAPNDWDYRPMPGV
jgi:putative transposase